MGEPGGLVEPEPEEGLCPLPGRLGPSGSRMADRRPREFLSGQMYGGYPGYTQKHEVFRWMYRDGGGKDSL